MQLGDKSERFGRQDLAEISRDAASEDDLVATGLGDRHA
jgi:hypothetical protein